MGGYYFFTADESKIKGNKIYLIEGKHSETDSLPSLEDIKDGLVKMILFTNLEEVKSNDKIYNPTAVLKLTVRRGFKTERLSKSQKRILDLLKKESITNGFKVLLV